MMLTSNEYPLLVYIVIIPVTISYKNSNTLITIPMVLSD